MSQRFGTIRGLDGCASERGTFTMLALDHRKGLRRILRPEDPDNVSFEEMVEFKRGVLAALASSSTGVLTDPDFGAAQAIVDGTLASGVGLVVALEQTGYMGPANARVSDIVPGWSVAQAKKMGADAVKLLLYYHPDAVNTVDQERLLMEVAEQCAEADMPLFMEPLSFPLEEGAAPLTGEARREVVVRTARRLTALGGDILKTEFPYDAGVTDADAWREACNELDEASGIPWVLLSAGVDAATFESQTQVACEAGASGVLGGRSVWGGGANLPSAERDAWQRSEGVARLDRLRAIVEASGRPWRDRSSLITDEPVSETWYADYRA